MRRPPPTLSRAEIDARATEKRQRVLDFLASGEVFTSARVVAALVNVGLRNSQRLLSSMTRDSLLVAEKIDVLGCTIYGVTPRGIALSSVNDPGPHFESGRVGALYIAHHFDCQAARLAAEAAGWRSWVPDRRLAARGFKKIPDAISTAPWGANIAFEIERTIKTPKRYSEIIASHLLQIKAGHYTHVIYISPRGESRVIQRALRRVETVRVNGESRRLTDAHFARFIFVDLDQFPRAVLLNTSSSRAAVEAHP
jgi:hypothetical protein